MAHSSEDPNNPWFYNPSLVAAILVSHVYFITTAVHIYQAFHYRARFCAALIAGGVWETLGYILRAVATRNEESIGLYAIQLTLIVLAPAFVAAFNYMLFGRLLRTYSNDAKALGVSAKWVTRIFVTFDVISFITQSAGAGILSSAKDDRKTGQTGQYIVVGGLIIQLVAFGFFTAVAVRFHSKMRRLEKVQTDFNSRAKEWRPLLFCLYASCILIIIRSVYRVVEFAQGFDGYLASHEVFFYVLEAVPMMPPFILFNIYHPGRIVEGGFKKTDIEGTIAEIPLEQPKEFEVQRTPRMSNEQV